MIAKKIILLGSIALMGLANAKPNLRVIDLGSYSLTPQPDPKSWGSLSFATRRVQSSEKTWHQRGKWAIGAPIQSYVESVELGTDEYLVSTLGGGLQLMDLKSLSARWTLNMRAGLAAKPLVLGPNVYAAGMDAYVYKVTLSNGKVEWKVKVSAESFGGIAASMGLVYVNTNDNMLWALDEKTGNTLWTYKRPGNDKPMIWSLRGQSVPKLSLDGKYIYLGFSDGYFVCLESASGTTLWERSFEKRGMFDDADTSPVISKDGKSVFVSIVDGDLLSLNSLTGTTQWAAANAGSAFAPLYDPKEGVLYAVGVNSVQKLDEKNGAQIWSYSTKSKGIPATPALLNDGAIVFGTSHFGWVMLSSQNGKTIWEKAYAAGLSAQMTSDGERFWLLSGRNRIHIFRAMKSDESRSLARLQKVERRFSPGARRNLSSPL